MHLIISSEWVGRDRLQISNNFTTVLLGVLGEVCQLSCADVQTTHKTSIMCCECGYKNDVYYFVKNLLELPINFCFISVWCLHVSQCLLNIIQMHFLSPAKLKKLENPKIYGIWRVVTVTQAVLGSLVIIVFKILKLETIIYRFYMTLWKVQKCMMLYCCILYSVRRYKIFHSPPPAHWEDSSKWSWVFTLSSSQARDMHHSTTLTSQW